MISQRLLNKFPMWSRARSDPSSLAARLYSVWGEYFDYAHADLKRENEDYKLLKRGLGVGYSFRVALAEADFMTYTSAINGQTVWVFPTTVTGTIGVTDYPVTRVDNADDLFWSVPNRISTEDVYGVNNFLIYSDDRAGNIVLNSIAYSAHLQVLAGASTNFYPKTPVVNTKASGRHFISIEGYDQNHSPITEWLEIADDGVFWTKNIFDEVVRVNPEGFNGPIAIYIGAELSSTGDVIDPFRACVLDDYEGRLYLDYGINAVSAVDHTYLRYFTKEIKLGQEYKDGSPEVVNENLIKADQYLLDASDAPYVAISLAVDPNSTRLTVLDNSGKIHLYDHEPTPFLPPQDTSVLTSVSYIDLIPVKHYGLVGETITFFTRHTRIRESVVGVTIYRIAPNAAVTYLQANKTWAGGSYEFPGTRLGLGENAEFSWIDFSFDTTHTMFGQYDYYCRVTTSKDVTVNSVSIMIDTLSAVASFVTGVTNPVAIWFAPNDRVVVTSSNNGPGGEANSFHTFEYHSDVYLPDPSNQVLFLREEYDTVEVI